MAGRKYKYLPHTADVAFVAYGKDMNEALENAALALLNTMLDLKRIAKRDSPSGSVRIRETASNKEDLVWFVLQDVLTRVDDKKLLAYRLKVNSLKSGRNGKESADCTLLFKKLKEDLFMLEVKAVTPHGLSVKKTAKGCEIRVLVDV
jgi:SHS2 domain-containing protein